MFRKTVSGILLFLFLVSTLTAAFNIQQAKAELKTIIVPDDYPTIQAAVNAATDGDTIIVRDGIYTENVNVNKSLTIKSEHGCDSTVVQAANSNDDVFDVTTDYVNIFGFTVEGATGGWKAGIHLVYADYCNISHNIASNNLFGILLDWPSNINVINNIASNNGADGVLLRYSQMGGLSYNNIINNTCSNNWNNGIDLEDSTGDNIINNTCLNNHNGYGIILWDSHCDTITKNTCLNNKLGIGLGESSGNTITNNICWNNDDGIILAYSGYNNIRNNTISSHRLGIYLIESRNQVVTDNSFENCGIQIGAGLEHELSFYNTHTIEGNIINGKPIYYYKDASGIKVPEDAGEVILANCTDITVENIDASDGSVGIELSYTVNSTISSNTIFNNSLYGIDLEDSDGNIIKNNYISNNEWGIFLRFSSGNSIACNTASNNHIGIDLVYSGNNKIYHNNFVNNIGQVSNYYSVNVWDDGYPSGGNYWSDYTGVDLKSGPNQDQPGSDGIGDTPYVIDANNRDRYPLMKPWTPTPPVQEWLFDSDFQYNLDDDYGTVEGTGHLSGTATLSAGNLSIEGQITLNGALPSGVPEVYLVATDGQDSEFAKQAVDLSGFGYWQTGTNTYNFTGQIPNVIQPINNGHYEVSALITYNTAKYEFFINTTSLINNHYFPLTPPPIVSPVPPQPVNIEPSDGATDVSLEPIFLSSPPLSDVTSEQIPWEEMDGIKFTRVYYHIQITTVPGDYSTPVYNFTDFWLIDQRFDFPPSPKSPYVSSGVLDYGTTYYWRIRYKDFRDVWSPWSKETSFTTPPRDFSIWASPSSLTIQPSSSGSSTINIGSINGFNQPVQLDVSGAPSGVTVTLSSSEVTPQAGGTATSTLTVSVATTATLGSYTLTVTGTSGSLTHSTHISLEITPLQKVLERPLVPNLIEPSPYVRATVSYRPVDDTTYEVLEVRFSSQGVSEGWIEFGIASSLARALSPLPTDIWYTLFFTRGEERVFPVNINVHRDYVMALSFGGVATGSIYFGESPLTPLARLSADLLHNSYPVTTTFEPETPVSEVTYQVVPFELAGLGSPGELRVYDSQGRTTGFVDGQPTEEIPYSMIINDSIVIFLSSGSYRYEVAGTAEGSYDLAVGLVENGNSTFFTATDIPTSPTTIHQYTIDWDALSQGEEGVTVMVDSDGDGVFEHTFTSDSELNYDEFMLQTATTIDIDPDVLNLKSKGKWITAYIEFPEGYNVSAIDVSSILLNGTIPVDLNAPTAIGDYDRDSIADLMVKFNRTQVVEYMLSQGITFGNVTLTLSGKLYDGTMFEGNAVLRVSSLLGDVNCDGKVDIKDLVLAAASYRSEEDEPKWNPNANFAQPYNRIDLIDLVTIAVHYGKTYE